jgi:Xaa-Pro aminopeptidase
VRYIANFDSFFGNTMVVLPLSGEPSLVTDSVMHSEPMHTGIWMTWIRDVRAGHHPATVRRAENICDFVIDVLKQQSLQDGQGGLVSTRWFPHVFMSRLSELLPEIHLRPAESVFESVRGIKSDMEISALRQAAEFASLGLNVAFEKAAAGMTEKELRTEAVHAMLRAGADGATVALTSGPRSGLKQAEPSERRIEEGDMLFLDVAGPCQGYVSDVARAGVVGRPNDQQRKMLETALEMRDRVVEAVKPGARICDLQSIAEGIAARRGFADHYCPTGFGHGIGTSKVESPILFPDNEAQLEENMVFSLEPMIVIEGVGTAVFEDMILVTSSGAEILSDATTSTW